MRVVVLSDIHANRPALDAVLDQVDHRAPDLVVVAGDVVNRGPHSRYCLERILERRDHNGWRVLKGNHEDYVILVDNAPLTADGWAHELFAHTRWTRDQIRDLLPLVQALPDHLSLPAPDGGEVRFLHASMRGNRSGLYEDMEDGAMAALVAPPPSVLVAGHTHVPFIRKLDGTLVVNAGSAGLPFDGDHRPSLAVLQWSNNAWSAGIVRIPYDRAAAEQDFETTGYLTRGGPMIPLILDELRQARPRLGLWHRVYEPRVSSGELTLPDSVALLLEECRTPARHHGWA